MLTAELTRLAKKFLFEHYGIRLAIPVQRNNRLRSTHGRFIIKNNRPEAIELAGYLLTFGARSVIIGVLKHECIHYALYVQGRDHRDGSIPFERELEKHDAPKTRTLKVGRYYSFTCDGCGKATSTRKKRVVTSSTQYRTVCCHSKLTVHGEKVYDGTEQ